MRRYDDGGLRSPDQMEIGGRWITIAPREIQLAGARWI